MASLLGELEDISARSLERGAREPIRLFLRVFLPLALAECMPFPSDTVLSRLCDASELSSEILKARAQSGISSDDVDRWEKYGNRLLQLKYPCIYQAGKGYFVQKPHKLAGESVAGQTDGIQTLLEICEDEGDFARAYLNGDVVYWGDDTGTIWARHHPNLAATGLVRRHVSPKPIRDLTFAPGYAHAIFLDDLGQLCLSSPGDKVTMIRSDPGARRLCPLYGHKQFLVASTRRGVSLLDMQRQHPISHWSVPGASTVMAPIAQPEYTFVVGTPLEVMWMDSRQPRPSARFWGHRYAPSEVHMRCGTSSGDLALLAAASSDGLYVWDPRRPGEALLKMHVPGPYPLGPPQCDAISLRSHVVMEARGDTVHTYSLLDGQPTSHTRLADRRICAIGPYRPPIPTSCRLDPHSMMALVSVRRPLVFFGQPPVQDNQTWDIF